MAQQIRLFAEHVRSFDKQQSVVLRPLTLLVGENSSGKSSFLAMASLVFDSWRFPLSAGFNEPPYNLGTYETIATYKGGRYGRASSFSLGFEIGDRSGATTDSLIADFINVHGQPGPRKIVVQKKNTKSTISFFDNKLKALLQLTSNDAVVDEFHFDSATSELEVFRNGYPIQLIASELITSLRSSPKAADSRWADVMKRPTFLNADSPFRHAVSIAPIRSKPRRTYDELGDEFHPEGDHIPTLLARLLKHEPHSDGAKRVVRAITKFGESSGLFRAVDVKVLGKNPHDPFQIQVQSGSSGPAANLVDVGYGVSQILPVIVQSALSERQRLFLLQQPEVHLHPRAQAALGSFFVDLLKTTKGTFLIETHSDHLVDRVRQEIAAGNISNDDVAILFFHKPKLETVVYSVTLDKQGNVEQPPECYREFFLQEEINILSGRLS
jgi:putative AbiEii toxin of type IV toxin-antitoxin system